MVTTALIEHISTLLILIKELLMAHFAIVNAGLCIAMACCLVSVLVVVATIFQILEGRTFWQCYWWRTCQHC